MTRSSGAGGYVGDGLVFGGVIATLYGIWLLFPPAAWIVGGLGLFLTGLRVAGVVLWTRRSP